MAAAVRKSLFFLSPYVKGISNGKSLMIWQSLPQVGQSSRVSRSPIPTKAQSCYAGDLPRGWLFVILVAALLFALADHAEIVIDTLSPRA
ncbi:hypothetical protein [Synechococcus sp. M16CYN]|uniref:hypothetical protein n=1 Tax=Synechococcus sp. M16CYN TaxID=3103139 RepID=UPI00333EC094